jgi:hypothetical protein
VFDKDPSTVQMENLSFIDMAALMNYHYAKHHGYNFVFYQMPIGEMPGAPACKHSSLGNRHPSWCKLVSLVHSQHKYPNAKYRVYLDSDMFVDRDSVEVGIDELLNAALPEVPSASASPTSCYRGDLCRENCSARAQDGDAWLTVTPEGLQGASVILRGGERGDAILKRVWNIGEGYSTRFPWEQMAWARTYNQSFKSDRRILGIGGLDAPWTRHKRPSRCNQYGNLHMDKFTRHSCHYEDDLMQLVNSGSLAARDRLRKLFQCNNGKPGIPMTDNLLKYNHPMGEEAKFLEHHNLHAGNRYLDYLGNLRKLQLTEQEFRQLYTEAYNSKVTLSPDDMDKLTLEMEVSRTKEMDAAEENAKMSLISGEDTSENVHETALREYYAKDQSLIAGEVLPKGTRWRMMESLCEEYTEGS